MLRTFNTRNRQLCGGETILEDPLLDRIFRGRGVSDAGDLTYSEEDLIPGDQMKDVAGAAAYLKENLDKAILIVGDYDCDGATATTIMKKGLEYLGANKVEFLVPSRFKTGYGLSLELAKIIAETHPHIEVLITVDNGIASVEGIAYLKEVMPELVIIVTDHHLPGATLPEPDFMINPNQPGCPFPSKCIAGCGVAFYLIQAIMQLRKAEGTLSEAIERAIGSLIEIVALGTIADVVTLDHNNRIFVACGIKRIQEQGYQLGLQALIEESGSDIARLTSTDLAFFVAPRLNAVGRMEDMTLGINCLVTESALTALRLSSELTAFNEHRKAVEKSMREQALVEVELEPGQAAYVVSSADWHEGVIGIVASRIKERYNRPTIVFTASEDGNLKGSGRSVDGIHIRDVLEAVHSRDSSLLVKFGGHAMAAGMTLAKEGLDRFRMLFQEEVARHLTQDILDNIMETDGEFPMDRFNVESIDRLNYAAPWGKDFPAPTFEGTFDVVSLDRFGKTGTHVKLEFKVPGHGKVQGILFNAVEADEELPELDRARVLFQPEVNRWQNPRTGVQREDLRFMVRALQRA